MDDTPDYLVFDLETQRSIADVGGRENFSQLGISVAVALHSRPEKLSTFFEAEIAGLIALLQQASLVVGFNVIDFDYHVLRGYSSFDFRSLPTIDLLQQIRQRLGFRISLDNLAQATLKAGKSASGLQALEWYQQGEWEKLKKYCADDVYLTRDLFEFGREHGYLQYYDRKWRKVKNVTVTW